jgi:predicted HTH domain antitoxin
MVAVEVNLSDELVSLLRESERSLEDAALEMIVLELYRRGALTSSRAAEPLGTERFSFIKYASSLGIPFIDMTEEEWDEEARLIESLRRGSGLSPTPAR